MKDIVFPKRYKSVRSKRWCIVEFDWKQSGTVVEVESSECVYDIGYYSEDWIPCDNKEFWEPVEEEHTVSEKEPFPEFEDISFRSVEFEFPDITLDDWLDGIVSTYIENMTPEEYYTIAKTAYENGVKVTWKLKEKINRKLHENKPLAIAIGRWLLVGHPITCKEGMLQSVAQLGTWETPFNMFCAVGTKWQRYATLQDDYEIPEQVLQWMKEYENEKN